MITEDQRKQARRQAAQQLASEQINASRNPLTDFASGVNETLISVAGFPVDVMNKALGFVGLGSEKPFFGTEQLTEAAQDVGALNAGLDDSRAERIGRIAGTVIPGVGIVGGLAKVKAITAPIIEGFRAAPKVFTAVEATSAGGAAIGGEIGREQGPVGEVIGQLAGGISAPVAITTAAKLPTFRLLRKASKPFTKGGAKDIAASVVQQSVRDKKLIKSLAENADLLPGQKLTLGGQAGVSRLLSLEKAVARKLPELADDMARNEAETNLAVTRALRSAGDIDNTVAFFASQRMRVENALRARMAVSVSKMNDSIAKLRPDASRADASRVISRELEDALSDIRIEETGIWDSLDGTQKLGLTATRKAFDDFVTKETPIPEFVKKALKGKKVKIKDFKDVRELRSRILRVQKGLRAQGNAEEAWILQQINKGILKDISDSNLGPDFSNAVSFSKSLNDKFTRGPVGSVLRFSPRGGRAVAPELASEELLATTAPKAALGVRAVRGAIGLPEKAVGSNAALEDALADSVKNRLFKSTGEFNKESAKKFVESNGELLDEFPSLKTQITNAFDDVTAQKGLADKIANANVGLHDTRRSAAAIILGANPEKRLVSILNNPKRKSMLAQAVRVSKKGPAAIEGLQDAYNTELFKRASGARDDAFGNRLLSGRNMREFFNETKDDILASGLYEKADITRLNTIINTAERLEKQVLARPESAEIVLQNASLIEDFILRVVGANLGAEFASGTGAPFVAAQAGSRFVRTIVEKLPFDKVTRVLGEAVKNPEMMKDFLTRPTSFSQKRDQIKRLNAWLAAIEPGEPITTEIEGEQ